MWSSKFEAYAEEKSQVKDIVSSSKSTAASGLRSNSVGNRLHRQQKSMTSSSQGTLQTDEDAEDAGSSEADQIKRSLEKVENHLIRNGGINCGWDAADHKDFLRIRTKHHNNACTLAFVQELLRCVPNIDDEGVKSHVRAYDTYLELCEFKKTLLVQYKEAKKKAQADRVTKLDTHNKMYSKLNSDLDLGEGSTESKQPNEQADREALKKQLESWKQEKENIKVREKEEKKRKEEQAKSMLSRKLLEENRAKKEQVEEFKYRKELEKMREQQIQEMEKRKQREMALN